MSLPSTTKQRLMWAAALLTLLAVLALYLEPGFMVTLADQMWACF